MASVAWGIDIGNRALKAVKLARGPEGVRIVDYAFIEHDTILSEAGDNRDSLVQTALAKFVGRHETRKIPICIGVSGQQSFARFVKLPPVEPKRIPEIVKFEAVQQIPFPLDEVEWSFQLFARDDDPDVEVGIFAMRKELVNQQVSYFLDVDLDVHAVQTSPLAVYNAIRHEGRLDKGHAVILDLGADSTDLIVADNDGIWMRSLDVGGNSFTEALAKAFKIDFEKAEEMKRNAKTSKYAKQIYQAMRPVFGELVGEIQRSLGFFQSSHRDAKLRKIIALGGGFKLNGLSGYLQKNLQLPVEKPQRFNSGMPEDAGASAALAEHVLSSNAAYGLALQLLAESKVSSSLLPTHIQQDKMWRDKTKYFVMASALVVLAGLMAFGSYLFKNDAYETNDPVRGRISSILSQGENLDTEWTRITNSGGDKLAQVQNVNQLVADRDYWAALLADIYDVLPGPSDETLQAMAGDFGTPNVIDDADKQALASTPRAQREYVQVAKIESVYTDDLDGVVNATDFYGAAGVVLSKRARDKFLGALPGAVTLREDRLIDNEKARGYIIRLTLTTPVPLARFFGRLDTSIPVALSTIQTPKYRFIAGFLPESAHAVRDDSEQLELLRQRHAARVAFQGVVEGGAAAGDPKTQAKTPGQPPRPGTGQRPGQGAGRAGSGGQTPFIGSGPGPANNRGGTAGTGSQADAANPAYFDPVTGESMLDDTVFVIILAVELDPAPAQAEPADEESGDEEEAVVAAD